MLYFELSLLNVYRFRILTTSWWIVPYVINLRSFLSLISYFCLEVCFFLILLHLPDFFLLVFPCYIFFHPISFNLSPITFWIYLFLTQHRARFCFIDTIKYLCFYWVNLIYSLLLSTYLDFCHSFQWLPLSFNMLE